jgi:hypothetical protein
VTAVFAVGTAPILLAHQGGWDEALLIGGPILIIVLLLRIAKRRVDAAYAESADVSHGTGPNLTDADPETHG